MPAPMVGFERLPAAVTRLLSEAADNAANAAAELARLMDGLDPAWMERLERREQAGDRITHDLVGALRQRRIAGRDRGRLRGLGEAIDDVTDAVHAAGAQAARCDCGTPARLIAEVLRDMARANRQIVRSLEGARDEWTADLQRVRALGHEAERRIRAATADAIVGQADPLLAVVRHDCLEHLAQAVSASKRMALAAEQLALATG